jgi:hypothetical protein
MDIIFLLIVAATIVIGLLAGASLVQSIVLLPARHRIGIIAYSKYSGASDLGNGILYYGALGVGAALLNIAAAMAASWQSLPSSRAGPVYIGALFAVLHSLATTQAAPTIFRQRHVSPDDEVLLERVFDKFEQWQSVRCVLQVINFGVNLWALIIYMQH